MDPGGREGKLPVTAGSLGTNGERVRCLIVEKRQGLSRRLVSLVHSAGLQVVAEVTSATDAERLLASRFEVDVVVASLESLDLATSVIRHMPTTPMLVLPFCPTKSEPVELLLRRLRRALTKESGVGGGARSVPSELASDALLLSKQSQEVLLNILRTKGLHVEEALTPRERQVIEQLTQGRSNKQIARALGIAEQTVKNYAHSVMRKVGVSSRTELCRWAIERGLHLADTRGSEVPGGASGTTEQKLARGEDDEVEME